MLVRFVKSSRRHYGVVVERASGPTVVAEPAPGYDDFLPHDLLHFVAEAEWGLDGAVFGQLAAGDDPGLFLPADEELVGRWVRDRKLRRTREHRRGDLEAARAEGARSEAIAGVLRFAWAARARKAPLPEYWDVLLTRAGVEPEQLDRVLHALDELAHRWHGLQVGRSLTLEWPRPEGRRHHRASAATRRSRTSRRVQRA
jgi:hypothetical protein